MTNLLSEWKGLALLGLFLALAAAFVATAIRPPWNERVLESIAEEQGNVVEGVRPQAPMRVAKR